MTARDELREAVARVIDPTPFALLDGMRERERLARVKNVSHGPAGDMVARRVREAYERADAALAVALPILQQHYAEVAEDASGSMGPVIAAAIRADEGPK